MDDPGLVRRRESVRDLAGDRKRSPYGNALFFSKLGREVQALHVGHRDVLNVIDLSDVIDSNDVLVA